MKRTACCQDLKEKRTQSNSLWVLLRQSPSQNLSMLTRAMVFIFAAMLSVTAAAQDVVESKMYAWKTPSAETDRKVLTSTIFEGRAHAMQHLKMSANSILSSNKKSLFTVPDTEEHLLIIRSGRVVVSLNDSLTTVGAGSIALLLPGEKYGLQNKWNEPCTFYLMQYTSKDSANTVKGDAAAGSILRDWNKVAFKPHDKGGIRNYFDRATAMCKRFEMHVTTLKEGIKSHEPHTHSAEEIVLIIENQTEMQIGNEFYKGAAGDIYYLGSNVPHAIQNIGTGTCTYFAFQFE